MEGEELVLDSTSGGTGGGAGDAGGSAGGNGEAGAGKSESGAEELDFDLDFGGESEGAGKTDEVDESLLSNEDKAKIEADKVKAEDEKALVNFKGTVAGRLKAMEKTAPELKAVFDKYPAVKEQLAAVMRRESALREVFPTVAEANQMRDEFPNGMQDVRVLRQAEADLTGLDSLYDGRNPDGTYPGHTKMMENFAARDKNAAIAFFREMPKFWAKFDRESYSDVFRQVIGATLTSRGIPKFLGELHRVATEGKQTDLAEGLQEVINWASGYTSDKPKPTADEERLANERKEFENTKLNSNKEAQKTFHTNFLAQSKAVQTGFIKGHAAVKRIMESRLSDDKKNSIVEQIRLLGERHLAKSPAFMSELKPAWGKRDMKATLDIQRRAWNNPFMLNRLVRAVLNKEIPSLVRNNRDALSRRTGAQGSGTPDKTGGGNKGGRQDTANKGPRQINGRWYKGDGTPFSVLEVTAGKHLQQ